MLTLSFYAWEGKPLNYDLLVRSYRLTTRIFRDVKLFTLAKEMIELEISLIFFKEESEQESLELDQMQLSIEILENAHSLNKKELEILLRKSDDLLNQSISTDNELLPILSLQANLFRFIHIAKGSIPETCKERFYSLLAGIDYPLAIQLSTIANPYPSKEELSLALRKASQSNHLDDLVHQLVPVVLIAENAIHSACQNKDIDLFLMASAVLSQPGLTLKNVITDSHDYKYTGQYAERAKRWLHSYTQIQAKEIVNKQLVEAQTLVNQFLPKPDTYFNQIASISSERTLEIINDDEILVILAEDVFGNLCRLIISEQFIQGPEVLPEETWSPTKFKIWQQRYPVEYGMWRPVREEGEKENPSKDEVFNSVSHLSIGEIRSTESKSLIISPSSKLFSFPFAISEKEKRFLAEDNQVSTIPSTIFLENARKKTSSVVKSVKAWLGAPETFDETLLYVRDTLLPIFKYYGIEVLENDLPDPLSDASIGFVVSHGSTGFLNHFKMVTDNVRYFSTKNFASRIAGCGSVILFICGAAMMDSETNSTEVRGLTRELLSLNTNAVIASPWSLNVDIPGLWLPPFLESVFSKRSIGFSSFMASQALKTKFDNPSAWAALQVYGDPEFNPFRILK